MHKLIVMLRVKDGMFFLDEWLRCFETIADEIVVLDNDSTDGTYETLIAHPKVTAIERTCDYHEGRDKNQLYALARSRQPDWCLWVDVDEIFEPGVNRSDFDRLMQRKGINKYAFRRFHFIDRKFFAGSWFRLNYMSGHDRILWREAPTGYFENFIIDSPNVKGISGWQHNTWIRLKHLGYINREIVDKKATLYRRIIPAKEKTFRRMYLENEKRIEWSDDRKSLRVRSLNLLLDGLLLLSLFPRAFRKIKSRIPAFAPASPVPDKATS